MHIVTYEVDDPAKSKEPLFIRAHRAKLWERATSCRNIEHSMPTRLRVKQNSQSGTDP